MKPHFTSGDYRRITRWEHEAVTDATEARLERAPEVDAGSASNGGASIRHPQSVDGGDALSDEHAATR